MPSISTQEDIHFMPYLIYALKTSPKRCLVKNIYQLKELSQSTIVGYVLEDLQGNLHTLAGAVERKHENVTLEMFKNEINLYASTLFDYRTENKLTILKIDLKTIREPTYEFTYVRQNNRLEIEEYCNYLLDNLSIFYYSNLPISDYHLIISKLLSILSNYTFTLIKNDVKTTYYFTNSDTSWVQSMKDNLPEKHGDVAKFLLRYKLKIEEAYQYSLSSKQSDIHRMDAIISNIILQRQELMFEHQIYLSTDNSYEKIYNIVDYDRLIINPFSEKTIKQVNANTFVLQ